MTDVPADTETQPTQHAGDSADDPALWIDTEHPERSGITATSTALGSDFPHGVFVCQDDDNTGPAS
ncbi:MAG TPA: phytase [Nocardioides sp.]|nr:phytase [Nocardioides sp.]